MGLDDAFEKSLALLPLATYRAGETILTEGSKSDRLLILKKGAVAIIKDFDRDRQSGGVLARCSEKSLRC